MVSKEGERADELQPAGPATAAAPNPRRLSCCSSQSSSILFFFCSGGRAVKSDGGH